VTSIKQEPAQKPSENASGNDSLIKMIIRSNLEMKTLSDQEVISNAIGIGVGGSDSTAAGITAVLFCLAKNSSVQEKLRKFIVQNDTELPQYLNAVIKEGHRLYPPFVSGLLRCTQQTEDVGNWKFQKGVSVLIDITAINRHPKYWENPESFLPERFLASENSTEHEGGKLLTFGLGKRACIGSRIAMLITRTWLTELIRNFSVEIQSEKSVIAHNGYGLHVPTPELKLCFKKI